MGREAPTTAKPSRSAISERERPDEDKEIARRREITAEWMADAIRRHAPLPLERFVSLLLGMAQDGALEARETLLRLDWSEAIEREALLKIVDHRVAGMSREDLHRLIDSLDRHAPPNE